MTSETSLIINVLAQLPVVFAFVWFVIYLLRYIAEQQKQRDETWLKQLDSYKNTCEGVNERLINALQDQDKRWQTFVQNRDEKYTETLKEIQADMRQQATESREDVRSLRDAIQDFIIKINDLISRAEGSG